MFAVSHHQDTLIVACHNQSDAFQCWSTATKTVTDGSTTFATSPGPGLYLDQATGKLYVYVTDVQTSTAGVACIDTTKPAADTGAQLFSGFTPLSGVATRPPTSPSSAPIRYQRTSPGRVRLVRVQRGPPHHRRCGHA